MTTKPTIKAPLPVPREELITRPLRSALSIRPCLSSRCCSPGPWYLGLWPKKTRPRCKQDLPNLGPTAVMMRMMPAPSVRTGVRASANDDGADDDDGGGDDVNDGDDDNDDNDDVVKC